MSLDRPLSPSPLPPFLSLCPPLSLPLSLFPSLPPSRLLSLSLSPLLSPPPPSLSVSPSLSPSPPPPRLPLSPSFRECQWGPRCNLVYKGRCCNQLVRSWTTTPQSVTRFEALQQTTERAVFDQRSLSGRTIETGLAPNGQPPRLLWSRLIHQVPSSA